MHVASHVRVLQLVEHLKQPTPAPASLKARFPTGQQSMALWPRGSHGAVAQRQPWRCGRHWGAIPAEVADAVAEGNEVVRQREHDHAARIRRAGLPRATADNTCSECTRRATSCCSPVARSKEIQKYGQVIDSIGVGRYGIGGR